MTMMVLGLLFIGVAAGLAALGAQMFKAGWDDRGKAAVAPLDHASPSPSQAQPAENNAPPVIAANAGARVETPPEEAPEKAQPPEPEPAAAEPATLSPEEARRRGQILSQLTNLWILSNDGHSPRMMAGMELPPVEFLNAELERGGERWHVRSTSGPNADTFDLQ